MARSRVLTWLVVTFFLVETFTILVVSGFGTTSYPPAGSSRGSSSVVAVSSLTATTPLPPVLDHDAEDVPNPPASSSSSSYPWRIVLDIGREPLARMPFDWARQGARMPLVVPSNFTCSKTGRRVVHVHGAGTVGFTDTGGAQESTIQGQDWNVQHDQKNHNRVSSFSCSYTIEQDLKRRDVYIEAGTELFLSTSLYMQSDLDELNAQYYAAREQIWSTGEKLNKAADRQTASKQWNTQTERWEKRYPTENPITAVQEQVAYWLAKLKQEQARTVRPEPDTLSDRGGKLPGRIRASSADGSDDDDDNEDDDDDEVVYLVQQGIIRYGNEKGPICGRWTGQPMTTLPAWERGQGR